MITLLSSSVQTLKAVAAATAAIVVLTPAKNLNKVFEGFLVVSPLFNHFLGYVIKISNGSLKFQKICLLAVAILFFFKFFNLTLDAPRTIYLLRVQDPVPY
jgi:hypothetical protein